ncbi:30S ribosomal protein S8 [Candidatus Woesearchaeota archaeon]|nr:30S ribosomal protein S8 [Candidatus Woesearchaeota archaeon]
MTLNDPLANVLSILLNEDKQGKNEIVIKYNSNLIRNVLKILKNSNYIGLFKEVKDNKGGKINVNLLGNINKCGVIKPRFNVKYSEYEKFEKRYLPALGFGILIISTNQGIMTHEEAIKKSLGGKLIAYIY